MSPSSRLPAATTRSATCSSPGTSAGSGPRRTAGLLAGLTDDSALRDADAEAAGAATLREQAATREEAAAAAEGTAQAAADAVRTRRDELDGKISAVRAALDRIPADQKSLLQTDAAVPATPVAV